MTRALPASLLVLFALAGCAATAPPASAPVAAPPQAASATAEARTDAEQAFLDQLVTINADLVDNPDRAIRRGENTCDEFDKPPGTQVNDTVERFSGSVTVTSAQARQILAAAQQTICKDE